MRTNLENVEKMTEQEKRYRRIVMRCSSIKECWNTENMIANICIASYLKCFSYLNSPFDAVFFSAIFFNKVIKKSSKNSSKFRTFFPFPKNVSKELFCFIQWKSVCDNPKSNIDNPTFPLKLSTTHLLICREHQDTMAKIDLYRKWALLYLKACH